MSEEKEKRYELDINGDKLILEEKVFNLLLNISHERDFAFDVMNKIYDAKTTFSNDADLGSFVRKLWNEMDNGTNQKPKTFA
jgi:methyl coenzyme M reductase subunit D